ncbi:MAG: hypothetical protein K5917_00805 [Clostridiales bacterium]|nr:hypothetical protein [Clostridiales bacterium]
MADRSKIENLAKCSMFLIFFVILFWFCNKVFILKRNDGITPMQNFYAQKQNTVDVLFCGPSLMGELGMDELWYDYGIAGYNLWGSGEPFWNCYFGLKEALKSQKPRVVVLEVSPASYQFEYSDNTGQLVNTQGMKFGKNFLDAIRVSTPKEKYLELFFGIQTFHWRFKELSRDDFLHFTWIQDCITDKGSFHYYHNNAKMDLTDISSIVEFKNLYPKAEEYLRLFIEYAQQRKIQVLLIKTPSINRMAEAPFYNCVSKIADEYGVKFIDTNRVSDEIGFELDDSADGGHINVRGMWKCTSYIGNVLRNEYNVPDRRGEKQYISYEKYTEKCHKKHIVEMKDKKGYAAEVLRSTQKPYLDLYVPIYFSSYNYNAPVFVRCGLSEPDNDFSWTDRRFLRMVCNFPKNCMGKDLKAKYNLAQIFNGNQRIIVYVNNSRVFDKKLSNGENLEFHFSLPADSVTAHIMLEFPNLLNNDKKNALAIKNVVFTE